MGFPVLTALIVLPAIGAALVVVTPRTRPELVRVIGFTVAMAVLVLAGYALYETWKVLARRAPLSPAAALAIVSTGLLASAFVARVGGPVAWLSAGVFAGTDLFWRLSISGQSTMLGSARRWGDTWSSRRRRIGPRSWRRSLARWSGLEE